MKKRSKYRLFIWLTILSGSILAVTVGAISLRIVQAGDRFTQNVLDEHRFFLTNTIGFAHGVMMHMGSVDYRKLIELTLECKSISYFGILNSEGIMLSQSNPPDGLSSLRETKIPDLIDGEVIEETELTTLVAFNAERVVSKGNQMSNHSMETPMGNHSMETPRGGNSLNPAWFLVGIDTTLFRKHFNDMIAQISVSAAVFFLLGTLIIVSLGLIQRYELAHLSIEKLNKIKRLMGYFVPKFAKQMIEQHPDREGLLDKYLEDVTVLFLDIEGFTLLLEKHSQTEINRVLEIYYSRFLDLITKNKGDINETAGDGLMVIFKGSDPAQHPQNAIRTALEIKKQCREDSQNENLNLFPIRVNIGIQSGNVYLGSTKIRGVESERWTYTASGAVTIMAARLTQYAKKGQIIVGDEAARRVDNIFKLDALGKVPLKNIQDSGLVYQVLG